MTEKKEWLASSTMKETTERTNRNETTFFQRCWQYYKKDLSLFFLLIIVLIGA